MTEENVDQYRDYSWEEHVARTLNAGSPAVAAVDTERMQKESLSGCQVAGQGKPSGLGDPVAIHEQIQREADTLAMAIWPQGAVAVKKVERTTAEVKVWESAVSALRTQIQIIGDRMGNHSLSAQMDHGAHMEKLRVLNLQLEEASEELDAAIDERDAAQAVWERVLNARNAAMGIPA